MEVVRGRISGRKKLEGKLFTIAELDETIFQIDGVLNYRCELSEAEGKEILTIDVISAEGNPMGRDALSQEVRRVLHRIPAVAEGLAGGQVKVTVNMDGIQLPISKGTAKRMITDRRSEA